MYCLCVNVYCTTPTGCQHNCSKQIYQHQYQLQHFRNHNSDMKQSPCKGDPHMFGVRDLCTWSSHPMNSPLDALVPYIADAIKRCLKIYLRCASTQISKKKVRMWNLKAERISGTYRSFTNNGSKYYDAIRYSFTATWLPPGGSGPYICTQKEKNRYIYKLN